MLKDLAAALGAPHSGYDPLEENYDLPATWQPHKSAGRFSPFYGGVRLRYGVDTAKAQKSVEQAVQEEHWGNGGPAADWLIPAQPRSRKLIV